MIGRISGILLEKNPPQLLVDCNGVGYEVDVSMSTYYNLPQLGERVTLFTHQAIREDAHLLFGFGSADERAVFRLLIKITGVGARIALAVLSGLSVADLSQAVARQEAGRLIKVPGIGKKTAERLLLELKDKLPQGGVSIGSTAPLGEDSQSDILNALLALGYNDKEAAAAMKGVTPGASVSDGIRQALKSLAK